MYATQLTVPAKNQPGVLAKVTKVLAGEKLNVRAITISSFGDEGFFNVLVEDPKAAEKALRKEGIEVVPKKVIAVLMDDKPGGLHDIVQLLADAGLNIENAYGFVLESWKNAVFVIEVDKADQARETLEKAGHKTLDAESLNAVEPFHYVKY
ncbi:MAG: ACT domain-containing protein [Proteobacteria bacterium]|nr:ACT domain-containing protein [Pseudomonadota bacterium]